MAVVGNGAEDYLHFPAINPPEGQRMSDGAARRTNFPSWKLWRK